MKILNIIITISLLMLSVATAAHTGIKSTSPKNQATLEKAPETLNLSFKSDVRLMKVKLLDTNDKTVDLHFKPSLKADMSFSVDLPELAVGIYKANWVSMGKDGHKMKGSFAFTVGSPSKPTEAVVASTQNTNNTTVKKPKGLPLPLVTVYKSASCGCCAAWIDHMKDSGFTVESHNAENLNQYKIKAKLGASLGSCHTAFVGDYAIEGHVPADDVKRLLSEKPDISGLTAPGMPMNSPGMAPKGSKPSGYDVLSFKDGEAMGVFSKY